MSRSLISYGVSIRNLAWGASLLLTVAESSLVAEHSARARGRFKAGTRNHLKLPDIAQVGNLLQGQRAGSFVRRRRSCDRLLSGDFEIRRLALFGRESLKSSYGGIKISADS